MRKTHFLFSDSLNRLSMVGLGGPRGAAMLKGVGVNARGLPYNLIIAFDVRAPTGKIPRHGKTL